MVPPYEAPLFVETACPPFTGGATQAEAGENCPGIPFPKGGLALSPFCQGDTPFVLSPTAGVARLIIFLERAFLCLISKTIASRAIRRTREPMTPAISNTLPG